MPNSLKTKTVIYIGITTNFISQRYLGHFWYYKMKKANKLKNLSGLCAPGESYQSRKLKKERVYFYGNGLFIHNILAQLLILSLILITKRKA